MNPKIKTIEELQEIISKLKSDGKKIVTINGCYDILHYGHVVLLEKAKKEGDILVVLINSDSSIRALKGEKRPIVSEKERAEIIAALGSVDYVTIFRDLKPFSYLEKIKPDVHVKAAEVVGETRKLIAQWGGVYKALGAEEGLSTTNIINKILQAYS